MAGKGGAEAAPSFGKRSMKGKVNGYIVSAVRK